MINYQGIVKDSNQQSVADGKYKMTFRIYDQANNVLWTEVHSQLSVNNGLFHAVLGTVTPLNLPFDRPYFLGLQVGEDKEITPRMRMASAGYSFHAENTDRVNGIEVSVTPQLNKLLPLDGKAQFPSSVLPDHGTSSRYLQKDKPETTTGNSSGDLLRVVNNGSGRGMTVVSAGSHGIYGKSSSAMAGVEGENAASGPGVRGSAKSHNGVIGYSEAVDKGGLYGNNANGPGVWGNSQSGNGVFGQSGNGNGVRGMGGGADKSGVLGEGTKGTGVHGRSNANDGVVGWTNSPDNSGVFGHSKFGHGVSGRSEGKDGVTGVTTSSNSGHAGVRGRNEGAGPAIACEGDLYVTGSIRGNVGSKNRAPFPRPAYDSNWQDISAGEKKILTHNIGGHPSTYIVDLRFKGSGFGIHHYRYGGDYYNSGKGPLFHPPGNDFTRYGVAWYELTHETITVHRFVGDEYTSQIRVRIWVFE
jgi:hypothetical protein